MYASAKEALRPSADPSPGSQGTGQKVFSLRFFSSEKVNTGGAVYAARHFLSKQGIAEIKSMLAKEIFQQDLISIYQRQTQRRDELTESAEEAMRQLVSEMQSGTLDSQRIGQLMAELAQRLQGRSGKKQYGYLPPALKSLVDEIVNELEKDPRIRRL